MILRFLTTLEYPEDGDDSDRISVQPIEDSNPTINGRRHYIEIQPFIIDGNASIRILDTEYPESIYSLTDEYRDSLDEYRGEYYIAVPLIKSNAIVRRRDIK